MKQIKIGYFADGIWSHNAFNKIINDNRFVICFIVPRYDSKDLVLFNLAKKHNIPYIKTNNINDIKFINDISKFECNLFVSMSFNQIFKQEILAIPNLKTINCHAGKLPLYRGRNVLNWVLINDEKEFGISVHYVDYGIDTGDLILQKTYPITDIDDYSTILNKAHKECAKLLHETLILIYLNKVKKIPQNNSLGFYCSARVDGDEIINWKMTSREVFNFIRAICPPSIGAKSYINKNEIIITKSIFLPNAPKYKCKEGVVVGLHKDGFLVKTLDSVIKISSYKYNKTIKLGDILTGGGVKHIK